MDHDEMLSELRAQVVAELREEVVAQLRAELLAELRSESPASGRPAESTSAVRCDATPAVRASVGDAGDPRTSRRRLLGTAAAVAAAAATGAVVGSAEPAAATTGAMQYGASNNAGASATSLISSAASGSLLLNNSASGIALDVLASSGYGARFGSTASIGAVGISGVPSGVTRPATAGLVGDSAGGPGLAGLSASGTGLQATSLTGPGLTATTTSGDAIVGYVSGSSSVTSAVFGEIEGTGSAGYFQVANPTGAGVAVRAVADHAQLRLAPYTSLRSAPTTDAKAHSRGELVIDGQGDLWSCTAAGTPGTWRKLSGPATAGQLHVLAAPVRVYDSRPGTLPPVGTKAKLAANVARAIDAKANGSGVPAGAPAILVNLLVLNAPNANANLTIWADGVARPSANTMVWGGSAGRFSTTTLSALSGTGSCQVVSSVATDLAVDVVGYYR